MLRDVLESLQKAFEAEAPAQACYKRVTKELAAAWRNTSPRNASVTFAAVGWWRGARRRAARALPAPYHRPKLPDVHRVIVPQEQLGLLCPLILFHQLPLALMVDQ